jgi:CDP-paratose 2-epimerase
MSPPKKILLTGACGFVGSIMARELIALSNGSLEVWGMDNLSRSGSEVNRVELRRLGVRLVHGDLRLASDLEAIPAVDWVIDAAANPSVLAGVAGAGSSRQLVEHNLGGTMNLLEFCRAKRAGFILLSTSRVYSVAVISAVPLATSEEAFTVEPNAALPEGISAAGVNEKCSTAPPVSLYGATKIASEVLALEYGEAFDLPVWINRCGVLAGGGQFGRADQGILAFWIHSFLRDAPLRFVGYGGRGQQVRDFLHPRDVAQLVWHQLRDPTRDVPRTVNVSGGIDRSRSLLQIHRWCETRFGRIRAVAGENAVRIYDVPWLVLDSASAAKHWGWRPSIGFDDIAEEIAAHAEANPDWLEISGARPRPAQS